VFPSSAKTVEPPSILATNIAPVPEACVRGIAAKFGEIVSLSKHPKGSLIKFANVQSAELITGTRVLVQGCAVIYTTGSTKNDRKVIASLHMGAPTSQEGYQARLKIAMTTPPKLTGATLKALDAQQSPKSPNSTNDIAEVEFAKALLPKSPDDLEECLVGMDLSKQAKIRAELSKLRSKSQSNKSTALKPAGGGSSSKNRV